MKNKFNWLLAFFMAFSAASVQAAPQTLKVVSATPKGQLMYAGNSPISITFNRPVGKLSEKDSFAGGKCPLVITPAVKGSCRFSGTQTLLFEPSENWPLATQYQVMLKKGFASAVNGAKLPDDYSFTFTTPRIFVRSTRPAKDERWLSLNPTLYIVFSTRPDLARAEKFLTLSYQEEPESSVVSKFLSRMGGGKKAQKPVLKTVPLLVREVAPEEHQRDFAWETRSDMLAVSPAKPLKRGVKYTLTVQENFPGAEGPLGLKKPYELTFYTYPALKTLGATTAGCLPYAPSVKFSSPVRLKDLLAAATVTPAEAKGRLSEADEMALGAEHLPATGAEAEKPGAVQEAYFDTPLSFLKLTPGQSVTVRLAPGLQDIYGNRLGQEETFTFTNEGYCPAVDYQGGTGVLESYLPARLPIELVNTPQLETQAVALAKDTFIPFQRESAGYCSKKEIKNATFNGNYAFRTPKDKSVKTYFDLEKFAPTAKDSIIFSQVRVPSKWRKDGYCWVSALSNITDLGITFKTSPDNTLLWVTHLKTAEPMPNLGVELRDKTNKVLWSGSTDMNGLVQAPGWKKLDIEQSGWGKPELYAFVSSPGGDAVVSSDWNNGLEPWRFNLNYDYNPQETINQMQLFADRGIYRPGETAHVKGVFRTLKNGVWSLPGYVRGTVYAYNSRGEEAFKQNVAVSSAFGTFHFDLPLPSNAPTGQWQVSFVPQGETNVQGTSFYFNVEAAKQAEFRVTLRAGEENYTPGQQAQFLATADYLFGAPVAGGKARWTVRQSPVYSLNIKGFDGYDFTPYFLRSEQKTENKVLLQANGELDKTGSVRFSLPMPKTEVPLDIYAETGVQSPANQELFARTSVRLSPAGFYLGVKNDVSNTEVGKPIEADVVAVTPAGVRTTAAVKVEIRKEQWFSVRKTGLSGRLEWVSSKKVTDFPSSAFTLPAEGYRYAYTPTEPGSYYITFSTQDSAGRKVLGGFQFVVFGKGEAYWKKSDDDILTLKTDKDSYKPGQTAKVQVESPYENALALVSVEREKVLDAWTAPVKGGADYVEVPVKPEYLPNVYVSVTLVRGRSSMDFDADGLDLGKPQAKQGYAVLNVQPESRRLDTQLKTNKKEYRPGEEVTLSLRTRVKGKNVPAEVTVYAVDEGILALTAYKTPDLFKAFYGSRPVAVSTADNRSLIIGQRNFGEKGENRGGGGGALDQLGGADLRGKFEFTPYFNANVVTDAKGRAEVKFKLPDNLTTFRVMAVGVTAAEFGSAESSIKVAKPLMLTSALPRFARKGDRFLCGAVVHNYADKKGQLKLSAAATGAVKLAPEEKTIQVAKGTSQAVYWDCEAVENGPAEIAFTARGAQESDGVKVKFTVETVEKEQTLSTYAATASTQKEVLQEPENLNLEGNNRVETAVSSTALVNLKGSMLYLLTYPYDCLEQKMSKILPVVQGADLIDSFKLGDTAALRQQTQAILDEIAKYQYPSGGFAYWPDALPDPYVTAYALEVNYLAKQKGYRVDEKALSSAVKWLKNSFGTQNRMAYPYSQAEKDTAHAYAVYVLALYNQKETARFNTLYMKRENLPQAAVAYLLKASVSGKYGSAAERQNLADLLLAGAVILPNTIHFQASSALPWLHFEDVKTTAITLDAALQAGVEMPAPYKVVNWLMTQLNAQGRWENTSVNAAVFGALDTYYRKQESAEPDFTAAIQLGAAQKLTASFAGRSVNAQTFAVPFSQVYAAGKEAPAVFTKNGSGTLFYALSQVYAPLYFDTPVDAGFSVKRALTTLDGKAVQSFKAGERYKVTLTVKSSGSRSFVVLEDFLPAGFELVSTALATESQVDVAVADGAIADGADLQTPDWGSFFRSEQYDSRIVAFADYLSAGEHTFTYLVSSTVPGTFAYPSAWAHMMYEPAVFGRTATQTLRIEP